MSEVVALPDSSLSDGTALSTGFTLWVFPNINFTCDGYITNWTLRVNNSVGSIPQITTWRRDEMAGLSYEQQTITNDSQLMSVKIGSGVIEYTPSPPGIPVQAGDIVGIRLPAVDDVEMLRIRPLFLRLPEGQGNSSTISCIRQVGDSDTFFFPNQMCNNGGEVEQSLYIPLISVIMSKLTHCMQVNFTKTAPNDSFYRYWHTFNYDALPYCNYSAAIHYGNHGSHNCRLSNYSARHYLRCDFYGHRCGYSATVVWG